MKCNHKNSITFKVIEDDNSSYTKITKYYSCGIVKDASYKSSLRSTPIFFLNFAIICVTKEEYDNTQINQIIFKQDCSFTVYYKDRADTDYNLYIQKGRSINSILNK